MPFPFQGEMMVCANCGRKQKSDPRVSSGWTMVTVEGSAPVKYCPDCFDALVGFIADENEGKFADEVLGVTQIIFTVSGRKGKSDGYLEVLLGTLAVAGIIVRYDVTKTTHPDGTETIYVDALVKALPLGHLGTDDIREVDQPPTLKL